MAIFGTSLAVPSAMALSNSTAGALVNMRGGGSSRPSSAHRTGQVLVLQGTSTAQAPSDVVHHSSMSRRAWSFRRRRARCWCRARSPPDSGPASGAVECKRNQRNTYSEALFEAITGRFWAICPRESQFLRHIFEHAPSVEPFAPPSRSAMLRERPNKCLSRYSDFCRVSTRKRGTRSDRFWRAPSYVLDRATRSHWHCSGPQTVA